MKIIIPLLTFVCCLCLLSSCGPDEEVQEECVFDARTACSSFSFSIVNADTYENLVGDGRLIDPEKVVVTNTRNDTMHISPFQFSDGWTTIGQFSPFQEITCFNQCVLDSAFTRTYYLHYGGSDTDTMEVFFPERKRDPIIYFNGLNGEVPDDRADSTGTGYSVYWFRKIIK